MMGAEASIDKSILPGLGVEHGQLAIVAIKWKDFGRRVARTLLAEIGGRGTAKTRGKPNAPFFVEQRVMIIRLGVPKFLVAPVRRGLHELIARRMARAQRFRRA